MDDPDTLLAILQDAVDLPHARQRNAITDVGFTTLNELLSITDSDLKEIFKSVEQNNRQLPAAQRISITMLKRKQIHALRSELLMRQICESEINDAALPQEIITTDALDVMVFKHNEWNELKKNKLNNLPEITITKLTQSNW